MMDLASMYVYGNMLTSSHGYGYYRSSSHLPQSLDPTPTNIFTLGSADEDFGSIEYNAIRGYETYVRNQKTFWCNILEIKFSEILDQDPTYFYIQGISEKYDFYVSRINNTIKEVVDRYNSTEVLETFVLPAGYGELFMTMEEEIAKEINILIDQMIVSVYRIIYSNKR